MFISSIIVLICANSVTGIKQNDEIQRLDGVYNNEASYKMGAMGEKLHRHSKCNYADGVYHINHGLPNPRVLSNTFFNGTSGIKHPKNITTALVFFFEMVLHEILDIEELACPLEYMKVAVPFGDTWFDTNNTGQVFMKYRRDRYDKTTGRGINQCREQVNQATAFIDASFIYGRTNARLERMRSFKKGMLRVGDENGYPPLNDKDIPMRNPPTPFKIPSDHYSRLFVLGDQRTNKNPGLLSFSILMFRWHNYNAIRFYNQHPEWTDEQTFHAARRYVIATFQKIVAYDMIPALLGVQLSQYTKYQPDINPSVSHEFILASSYYTSMLPPALFMRKTAHNCAFEPRVVRLCQTWWNGEAVVKKYGMAGVILGMASQIAERADNVYVDDVRNAESGRKEFSRIDKVVEYILRGRDHGMAPYNVVRRTFGMSSKTWETINEDQNMVDKLRQLYGDIDSLDFFVGGMLEGGEDGPGELFSAIIKNQFERIRDGDRFWFENRLNGMFSEEEMEGIRNVTLADVIRNTINSDEVIKIQDNVFISDSSNPCHQPYQVNDTGIEKCSPLIIGTYWSHDGASFLATIIGIFVFTGVLFAIGFYAKYRRNEKGHIISYRLFSWFEKEADYVVHAFEQLFDSTERRIRIELKGTRMKVIQRFGSSGCEFELARNRGGIDVMHSTNFSDKMEYHMLIFDKSNQLMIRLDTKEDLKKLITTIKQSGRGNTVREVEEIQRMTTKVEKSSKFFEKIMEYAENGKDIDKDTAELTVTRSELESEMNMRKGNVFVNSLFSYLSSGNQIMAFHQFLDGYRRFRKSDSKLQLLYEMCEPTNGLISTDKLLSLLKALINTVSVKSVDYDNCIKNVIGSDNLISFDQFSSIFEHLRSEAINFPVPSLATNRNPLNHKKSTGKRNWNMKNLWNTFESYLEANRQIIFTIIVVTSASLVYASSRYWHYAYMLAGRDLHRVFGYWNATTRAAAGGLTICMSLMLLTVCRNVMTILRTMVIGQYIPFDSAITLHKILAVMVFIWSTIHTICHFHNFYQIAVQSPEGLMCLFGDLGFGSNSSPSIGFWLYGTITGFTGMALVLIMLIIYVYALPIFVRSIFAFFHFTHYLTFLVIAMTILHGLPGLMEPGRYGLFIIFSSVVYCIDQIIGSKNHFRNLKLVHAEILDAQVIHIQIERPRSFEYKSGQWLTISSSQISSIVNNTHAFSLASSPDQSTIDLYIKAQGPWTWELEKAIRHSQMFGVEKPLIDLKGPYGDGNQEWMNYEMAIMIGGGIGVTPYTSTLNDLVALANNAHNIMACRKVYFIWVCKSAREYGWFVDKLRRIEDGLKDDGILEMRTYFTIYQSTDMRAVVLNDCDKMIRKTQARSIFTGLKAQHYFGRPKFDEIFEGIQEEYETIIGKGKIGVFSCGLPSMNDMIADACSIVNRNRNAPLFQHRFETF